MLKCAIGPCFPDRSRRQPRRMFGLRRHPIAAGTGHGMYFNPATAGHPLGGCNRIGVFQRDTVRSYERFQPFCELAWIALYRGEWWERFAFRLRIRLI